MTALTPAQRAKNYRLRKRTKKTVIAAAERCEAACVSADDFERNPARWFAARHARHRAELASIQAFAAVAHMQKILNGEQT